MFVNFHLPNSSVDNGNLLRIQFPNVTFTSMTLGYQMSISTFVTSSVQQLIEIITNQSFITVGTSVTINI